LVFLSLLVLVGSFAEARRTDGTPLILRAYWLVLPITATVIFALLGQNLAQRPVAIVWAAVLLVDLWTLHAGLVAVRQQSEIETPSDCIRSLVELNRDHGRVLGRAPTGKTSSPLWPALPLTLGQESLSGFNPLDVRRFKEYLQFIADEDTPLR